jgi:hypothetical protein
MRNPEFRFTFVEGMCKKFDRHSKKMNHACDNVQPFCMLWLPRKLRVQNNLTPKPGQRPLTGERRRNRHGRKVSRLVRSIRCGFLLLALWEVRARFTVAVTISVPTASIKPY